MADDSYGSDDDGGLQIETYDDFVPPDYNLEEEDEDQVFDDLFTDGPAYKPDKDHEVNEALPQKNYAHRSTFVGTPLYVSPEMLDMNCSGPFTDLWGLGVIVYQLLTGEVPWKSKNDEYALFQQIMQR